MADETKDITIERVGTISALESWDAVSFIEGNYYQNPIYPIDANLTEEQIGVMARSASMVRADSPGERICIIDQATISSDEQNPNSHLHSYKENMDWRHDHVIGDSDAWTYWLLYDQWAEIAPIPVEPPPEKRPPPGWCPTLRVVPNGISQFDAQATWGELGTIGGGDMLDIHGLFWIDLNGTNVVGLTGPAFRRIQFTNAIRNKYGYWNFTTHRFMPTVAGIYFVHLNALTSYASVNDSGQAAIYKNGAICAAGSYIQSVSQSNYSSVSTFVAMDGESDYVEAYCYIPTGANIIRGDKEGTYMFGYRMAAL